MSHLIEKRRENSASRSRRSGEERALAAIGAMGQGRGVPFRLTWIAISISCGTPSPRSDGSRAWVPRCERNTVLHRRGRYTATAHIVLHVVGRAWTIDECGDRDLPAHGAGTILQALITREPVLAERHFLNESSLRRRHESSNTRAQTRRSRPEGLGPQPCAPRSRNRSNWFQHPWPARSSTILG